MPIYEYECQQCHHAFDLIQKVNDAPEEICPACGKKTAVRLVSAAGFQLKGTGWYVTDFKNKPKENKTSEKKPAETTQTSTEAASTQSTTGTTGSDSN